jgi:hypothetical protein
MEAQHSCQSTLAVQLGNRLPFVERTGRANSCCTFLAPAKCQLKSSRIISLTDEHTGGIVLQRNAPKAGTLDTGGPFYQGAATPFCVCREVHRRVAVTAALVSFLLAKHGQTLCAHPALKYTTEATPSP